jgi:tetratricopeptide (TPR) repeat protein
MKDSQSWYVLGNAHMTNFFVNHDINVGELQSALKAYAQTEKNLKEPNPDLYYNRATIYEYLERYNEAVQDFTLAHQVDPNLGADQKCNNIIGFVSRSYNSIVNKGKLKSNRLTSMVGSIPRTIPNMDSQYKICDISELNSDENPGMMVSAKVVNNLYKDSDVPMCFLLVDYKHNFCVTSIYHMSKSVTDKIKPGSDVLIKNPHLVLIQLQFKGYQYNYQCLKVTDISNILVDGQSLNEDSAFSEVISKTFS